MSTKARIEHVFNCSADTYFSKVFFDEEYNRRLFLEYLNFESHKVVSLEDTDKTTKRVVDAVPRLPELPGPLKKFAEGGVGYRETAVLDKASKRVNVEVDPSSLKGKLTITGQLFCEPLGDNKCRRVYETVIDCKVFGVGGMIEKRILQDVEESYAKAATFTNQFIAEKGLT